MAKKNSPTKLATPAAAQAKPAKRPVGRPATGKTYINRSFAIPKHNYQAIVDQFTAIIQAERAKMKEKDAPKADPVPEPIKKAQKLPKTPVKKEIPAPVTAKKEASKTAKYDTGMSSYLKKRQGQKNGIN
jgi:hypothetical protein